MLCAPAGDLTLKLLQRAIGKREPQYTIWIHRARKFEAALGQAAETHAGVVWLIPHQNNGAMSEALGLFDTTLHQSNADAPSSLVGFHRQRPQKKRRLCTNGDRPEANGATQNSVLDGHEAECVLWLDAFTQPVGRFCEARRPEHFCNQCLDSRRITGLFRPDFPIFGLVAHVSSE